MYIFFVGTTIVHVLRLASSLLLPATLLTSFFASIFSLKDACSALLEDRSISSWTLSSLVS
jgi:hypothetical protein